MESGCKKLVELPAMYTPVRVVESDMKGIIIGIAWFNRKGPKGSLAEKCFLVELDKGFWSEDKNTYVSVLVVHHENVEVVDGRDYVRNPTLLQRPR